MRIDDVMGTRLDWYDLTVFRVVFALHGRELGVAGPSLSQTIQRHRRNAAHESHPIHTGR